MNDRFYNEDCIAGARKHLADGSVDLIITDPPYGIGGDTLHKHYNRDERYVLDGYVEVPQEDYAAFSLDWIRQAERVLKPGGSLYIVSGYTNLRHILNALAATALQEINHLIWKYNFGVYTKMKYISSHYHILFYRKSGGDPTFNTHCRYGDSEKHTEGGSANYRDREDVWRINREYKPGTIKNKNTLPSELLMKMIQYSSQEGDVVCDFFLGSFATANVAKGLNRCAVGFEVNSTTFAHHERAFHELERGFLLSRLRAPLANRYVNGGKAVSTEERATIVKAYADLREGGANKKDALDTLSEQFGRGYWSLLRIIDDATNGRAKKRAPLA